MQPRRTFVTLVGTGMVGSLAGCTDRIPFIGDDATEFSAEPASVTEAARDETGYEEHQIEAVEIERTYEVSEQTHAVIVTNWQAEYDKAVDFGATGLPVDDRIQGAIFTVLATPQVRLLGRTFNPVADMDSTALAAMVQDRYEGIGELEHVGESGVTVTGESTTMGEFEGTADLVDAGVTVDLTLHITAAVESGDDFLVCIGGYPTALRDEEYDNIGIMVDGIEHP